MNNETLILETLKKLHFTDKECAIYLALLRLGTAPASILAHKTKMPRPTARFTCELLAKRHLIESIQKGNTIIYSIDSPEKLFYILDQKEAELEEQRADLDRVMSTLKTMRNPHSVLPKVQYFEGVDAICDSLAHVLDGVEAGDEILSFTFPLSMESDLPVESTEKILRASQTQIKKRIANKVKARMLAFYSKSAQDHQKKDKESLRETRFIDPLYANFSGGEIMIFKNTLYALTLDQNTYFAYKVENPSLIAMYRAFFEICWDSASADYQKIKKKKKS